MKSLLRGDFRPCRFDRRRRMLDLGVPPNPWLGSLYEESP
jgi:hypothetical protein